MKVETYEQFQNIILSAANKEPYRPCRIMAGLKVIIKYLPGMGIETAEHDQIWSASVEELIDAGITGNDVLYLGNLGWFIDNDAVSHFV